MRTFVAWLAAPGLWIMLATGLVLWTLAYQQHYAYRLDFGGDRVTQRRYDDAPYLLDFNAPEPTDTLWLSKPDLLPYRWTQAVSTIRLPGIGGGTWIVRVLAQGQPGGGVTQSAWSDGTTTIMVPIARSPQPRVYHILARAQDGDLTVRFATQPFEAPGDARSLGFIAYYAAIAPSANGSTPAPGQLMLLAAAVALCYGMAWRLGFDVRSTLVVGLALVAGLSLLLARYRLPLTVFTPTLLPLLAACYGLTVVGRWVISGSRWGRLSSTGGLSRSSYHRNAIVGLIVLSFALRLGGMLHPHARDSDVGLNVHNLAAPPQGFTAGDVYFTEGLPARAGGGQAPYPPGQYIVLAPFQLLFPPGDGGRRILLQIGNALLDSLVVGLLWYLLRRSGVDGRAALLGAALYTVAPPALRSLSVGEFANIFGQGLGMPLLATLTLAAGRLRERGIWVSACALMALALLGHMGVTISLVLLLICLTLEWLIARRRLFAPLALLILLAFALVGLFYYSAFGHLIAEPATATQAIVAPTGLVQKLANQLGDNRGIHALAVILGFVGFMVLHPDHAGASPRGALWLLLLAWWGSIALSFGLFLFASQGVRWQLFLYPLLCLGAGPALAALRSRGRMGSFIAVMILAYLFLDGVMQWVTQISNYLH